jgi:hypothetical protein
LEIYCFPFNALPLFFHILHNALPERASVFSSLFHFLRLQVVSEDLSGVDDVVVVFLADAAQKRKQFPFNVCS